MPAKTTLEHIQDKMKELRVLPIHVAKHLGISLLDTNKYLYGGKRMSYQTLYQICDLLDLDPLDVVKK